MPSSTHILFIFRTTPSLFPCPTIVIPGLVAVGHRVCDGHRAAPRERWPAVAWGAFPGIAPGLAAHIVTAGHQVGVHFGPLWSFSFILWLWHGIRLYADRMGLILTKQNKFTIEIHKRNDMRIRNQVPIGTWFKHMPYLHALTPIPTSVRYSIRNCTFATTDLHDNVFPLTTRHWFFAFSLRFFRFFFRVWKTTKGNTIALVNNPRKRKNEAKKWKIIPV